MGNLVEKTVSELMIEVIKEQKKSSVDRIWKKSFGDEINRR